MSFSVRLSVLVVCIVLSSLVALPSFFDSSLLKLQLEQKISHKLNGNVIIKGSVSVVFLPLPGVVIRDANLENWRKDNNVINVKVGSVVLRPTLFSLFGDVKIKKVILNSPTIELGMSDKSLEGVEKLQIPAVKSQGSEGIYNFRDSPSEIFDLKNIPKIQIEDGHLIKKDINGKVAIDFKSLDAIVKNNLQDQIFHIKGSFSSDGVPTNIEITVDVNRNNDSKLVITSPVINLVLSGKFSDSNINDLVKSSFSGKLDANIVDLKSVLNQYFSKTNIIYRKINTSKPIKISANIVDVKGEIKMDKIIINSALMSGEGQINANFSKERPVIDISFILNHIDIDNLWISKIEVDDQKLIKYENDAIGNFIANKIMESGIDASSSMINNMDLTAEVKIKSARYMSGDLRDVDLYFMVPQKGKLLLQPLSFKIPGEGEVKINGAFDSNNNVPKFIGKFDIKGKNLGIFLDWAKIESSILRKEALKDYKMSADLLISPNFLILNNIGIHLNNSKNILSGSIKHDSSNNSYEGILGVNKVDIEDYFWISGDKSYLAGSPVLKKFLWLNTVNYISNISLNFDKLIYKDNIFNNQAMQFKVRQGLINLSKTNFKAKDIDLDVSMRIDIMSRVPHFKLDLDVRHIKYVSQNSDPELELFDGLFNLPSFKNFDGLVNINLQNLELNDFKVHDFKISSLLKDGSVKLENLAIDLYGGKLKFNGIVLVKTTKTINGGFEFVEVDNTKILDGLFGIKDISGISSLSGVVGSFGQNRTEFMKNLDLQLQFIGGNVVLKGFGLDSLVSKMANYKYYSSELEDPLKIIFNKDDNTILGSIKGSLDIRRNTGKNQLKIETNMVSKSLAVNSVTTGQVNFGNREINALSEMIFISRGSNEPLTIAVNYRWIEPKLTLSANITQIEDHLKRKSEQFKRSNNEQ